MSNALRGLWFRGVLKRSVEPLNLRDSKKHLCILSNDGEGRMTVDGVTYSSFDEILLDSRECHRDLSKLELIARFLRNNLGKSFYSTEIKQALEEYRVNQ